MYHITTFGDKSNSYNTCAFICDTESDIDTLPTANKPDAKGMCCAPGSTATVISPFGVYILGVSDDTWHKI